MNNVCTLARAPGGQMKGAATQAMSVYIVEERQRSRCAPAAAPLRAAARRPAAKCKRYSWTGPKIGRIWGAQLQTRLRGCRALLVPGASGGTPRG